MYNTNKEEYCDKRLASGSYKLSKHRQPSLSRVAVVAFYTNCDGKTKHMNRYCNRHAHHLLSVNDGQPPALSAVFLLLL